MNHSTPPVAARHPVLREHHGDVFEDPYEWLRDGENPDVLALLEAENAWAERVTAPLAPLRASIFDEIKSRVQETDLSVPVASGPWWYLTRTVEGEQYPIHTRMPRAPGDPRPVLSAEGTRRVDGILTLLPGEELVLDQSVEAGEAEFFEVGIFSISPDHRLLAVGIDRSGDERYDLEIRDLATGAVLDAAVTGIGYGLEWSLDGRYVVHTRLDDAWRSHEVWRHRVGGDPTDPLTDVLVLREDDERFWVGLGGSRDDRWVLVGTGSKTSSEVHLLDAADPLGPLRCVAPRRDGVEYDVEVAGDRLLVLHNADRLDADLAWAPLEATSPDDWRPLLAGADGERFVGVDAFADHAVLALRRDGMTQLRVLPTDPSSATGYGTPWDVPFGDEVHTVDLADNAEWRAPTLLVSHESMTSPRAVLELDLATRELTLLRRQPVLGGYDPADYAQSREWAMAPDGTRVPITLVHRRGIRPEGTHPGLLTGYGAYEHSRDPYFSVARLSLLDRGVVYAVAHVRGGGELGRGWYDDGKMARKPHTFTDFVACGRHLIERGWVHPDRLAAEGGSAGGLLIGAAVNLAPELFRVVHAAVPFVDALTTMLRPDLPLTVGEWEEWGDPLHDAEQYAWIKAYTPYENIRPVPYPAVLATTSLNDTRVFFTEAAKWVAMLRSVVTNDPLARPILLRTEMVAGHGGRSGRYAAWHQVAWEWAFLLGQLGVSE